MSRQFARHHPASRAFRHGLFAAGSLCLALAGCAEPRFSLETSSYEAATTAERGSRVEAESGISEERDSFYKEYTPWRRSARPAVQSVDLGTPASTPLSYAAASPEETGSTSLAEAFPEDPEQLQKWLDERRERSRQVHAVSQARLDEIEQEGARTTRSICTGC